MEGETQVRLKLLRWNEKMLMYRRARSTACTASNLRPTRHQRDCDLPGALIPIVKDAVTGTEGS